ncbi:MULTISPECIES: hypothetical protein [unclassified Agarivorans]|uniref:hypothetical protein n=1 Tax=unclassified Agarivorans TaxID=2636026 RepID=UPI003D7C87B1
MNISPHSTQGYQHRDELFIDGSLLVFVEQQLSSHEGGAVDDFLEALAILVDEFGPRYRRLNQNSQEMSCDEHLSRCQQSLTMSTAINISRGSSKAVLDQHSCAIPSCIFDALLTAMIAHQRGWVLSLSTSKPLEAVLMEALFKRAQQLMNLSDVQVEVLPPLDNVACIAQARQQATFSERSLVSHA